MTIQFGSGVCGNLDVASRKEWLETNGLGGYASSTAAGLNTRRYHGLLVAALRPPVDRQVLLSKLEETVLIDGRHYDLSVNRYPGAVHPQGFRYLQDFRLDPFPVFVYQIEDLEIEKRVYMVYGENTTVIEYEVRGLGAGSVTLELRPLVAFRDYHSLAHRNDGFDGGFSHDAPGLIAMTPYRGGPTFFLGHDRGEAVKTGDWYYNFEYDVERERGLDYREDLFNPLVIRVPLSAAQSGVAITASVEGRRADDAPVLRAAEIARRRALVESTPCEDDLVRTLTAAADQYIVRRGDQHTVIAGYPWFSDWGRDTMIALPGLTLATGRADVAKEILREFSRHVSRGMLPNRFPDGGEQPEYNTVDATLWFFEAIRAYLEHTGDREFVELELQPVLVDIIGWHMRGTRYGIRMDSDGLLRCGEPGVQLTWMDAKVGDWVVTPRYGKPVEIQALWYNALKILETISRDPVYGEMAARAAVSFNAQFWNEPQQCLYDVVDGDTHDGSIRPNQIFAVSLRYSMLSQERAAAVLAVAHRELLTPYGLRSLSPFDPRYRGVYQGGVVERDGAYHQGTVWPWLLGAYVDGWRKVHGYTPDVFGDLREHLLDAGLGQISEIFDADAPHRARGCYAQAWSVAEVLRVMAGVGNREHREAAIAGR